MTTQIGAYRARFSDAVHRPCIRGVGGAATDCVSSIRYGSDRAGYAYGPSLFHTLDAGYSWQKENDSAPTLRLEYAGPSAFRITGYANTLDCFGGCHVQRAANTGAPWTDTGIVVRMAGAAIIPEGSQRIYVLGLANPAGGASNKKAAISYSGNAGSSWQTRDDPCPGNSFTVMAATAPTGQIAILCESNDGSEATIMRSVDSAQTFHAAGSAPITAGLTAGSATTFSGLQFGPSATTVNTSLDGGAHWRATLLCQGSGQPAAGLALGYQDAYTAHLICPGSTTWRSRDGGATWTEAKFSP